VQCGSKTAATEREGSSAPASVEARGGKWRILHSAIRVSPTGPGELWSSETWALTQAAWSLPIGRHPGGETCPADCWCRCAVTCFRSTRCGPLGTLPVLPGARRGLGHLETTPCCRGGPGPAGVSRCWACVQQVTIHADNPKRTWRALTVPRATNCLAAAGLAHSPDPPGAALTDSGLARRASL